MCYYIHWMLIHTDDILGGGEWCLDFAVTILRSCLADCTIEPLGRDFFMRLVTDYRRLYLWEGWFWKNLPVCPSWLSTLLFCRMWSFWNNLCVPTLGSSSMRCTQVSLSLLPPEYYPLMALPDGAVKHWALVLWLLLRAYRVYLNLFGNLGLVGKHMLKHL